MIEHLWAWKEKTSGTIILPTSHRKTIEELFANSSFHLPVREIVSHLPIRVRFDAGKAQWIEQTEDEKDRLWRLVVAASSR